MANKNEKANQHYVPKFYLRNFTNQKNSIATYIHSQNKFVQHASLDSVASKEYFYGKDLLIENMFSKYEGIWAEAFRIFLENRDCTDQAFEDALFAILSFIAFQHSRTLRVYQSQLETKQFLTQYTIQHSSSLSSAEKLLQRYYPQNLNLMEAPISVSPRLIDSFKSLSCLLLNNNSDIPFITSDNPVVLYNPFLVYHNYRGEYGFSALGLCVFVPLSPEICLCLYDPKVYYSSDGDICSISSETAHELNRLICRNAYNYTFFSDKHTQEYAENLSNSYIDRLDSKSSIVQSNIGSVIRIQNPSILEKYTFPFIVMRKTARRIHVSLYGPPPHRYI